MINNMMIRSDMVLVTAAQYHSGDNTVGMIELVRCTERGSMLNPVSPGMEVFGATVPAVRDKAGRMIAVNDGDWVIVTHDGDKVVIGNDMFTKLYKQAR